MYAELANVLLIMLMLNLYYFSLIVLRDLIRGLELLKHNIGKTYEWFTFLFVLVVLGDLRRRDSAEAGGLQSQRQHRRRMQG